MTVIINQMYGTFHWESFCSSSATHRSTGTAGIFLDKTQSMFPRSIIFQNWLRVRINKIHAKMYIIIHTNFYKDIQWQLTSLQRNSRMLERSTFRPSAEREYGVLPAPFNWTSHLSFLLFTTSPR